MNRELPVDRLEMIPNRMDADVTMGGNHGRPLTIGQSTHDFRFSRCEPVQEESSTSGFS